MTQVTADPGCNQCGAREHKSIFSKSGYDLVGCTSCGLAYIANPPSAEELARIYSLDANYHRDLLDPSSAAFAAMQALAQRHLATVVRATAPGRLLDIGCSTGLFLDAARHVGYQTQGIEFSTASADFARDHFALDVVQGDVASAKLAPASFDVVTMFDVIEHVPDPLADLRAIHALLAPGGTLIISTPNIDGLFPKLSYGLAARLGYWPHPDPPHHLFQFSVKSMAAMLEKAGFVAGRVEHTHIDLAYSFGSWRTLARSPKMLAYALLFAPSALLGPWLGAGDWFYMVARKA